MARANQQPRDSLYEQVFNQSFHPMALLDNQGKWLQANQSLQTLLGDIWGPGQDWLLAVQGADELSLAQASALAGEAQRQIPIVWIKGEQEVQALASIQRLDNVQPTVLLLMLQVLPGSSAAGIRDPLTGLIGHALFMDRLHLALARKRRNRTELAMMMISIDNLVPISSEQGGHIADLLLQATSERLQSCVRRSDSLARLGGDSFAIMLEEVGTSLEAITLAGKLCDSLRQEIVLQGTVFQLDVSLGAVMARSDQEAWELVRQADQALYQAQQNGGNTYEIVM